MILPTAVSDSSALIGLDRIGRLDLLRQLFGTVLVPPSVVDEVGPRLALPQWIISRSLAQPIRPGIARAALGPGETAAISLALEVGAEWVILDDLGARRLAEAQGLPVIGTLGLLVVAKRQGELTAVRPCVDALLRAGFRIGPELYDEILSDAGE